MQRRTFLQNIASAPVIVAGWKQNPPKSFEAEITEMMAVAPVPGLVMGTLIQGKPGWVHPLGVRSVATQEPVKDDTIFQAASLSKQVTA